MAKQPEHDPIDKEKVLSSQATCLVFDVNFWVVDLIMRMNSLGIKETKWSYKSDNPDNDDAHSDDQYLIIQWW